MKLTDDMTAYMKSRGLDVDLDYEQAKAIMETAEYREGSRPQIFYDGHWWDLARTDLYDDVATSGLTEIERYKTNMCYGVRLKVFLDGQRSFRIIDSTSDH